MAFMQKIVGSRAVVRGVLALSCCLAVLSGAGCGVRKAMYDQPKVRSLGASDFFADGQGSRTLVPGTIARGKLHSDTLLFEGLSAGRPAEQFPMEVTREVVLRGRERFDIYCAPCHDRTGSGNGMVVQRGFKRPPSFHDPRLRTVPAGYVYSVIRNGFGQMPSYARQIPPEDRWAIVAYIRALQLSHQAAITDVPADERAELLAKGGEQK